MPEIPIKIVANFPLKKGREVENWEEFLRQLPYATFGVWSELPFPTNLKEVTLYTPEGTPLTYSDVILNYLYLLNRVSREQIGVCIDREIPRILDNRLPYLIIQRKGRPELDQNLFIAVDGEVYFPMVSPKPELEFALYKLAELSVRTGIPIQRWIDG